MELPKVEMLGGRNELFWGDLGVPEGGSFALAELAPAMTTAQVAGLVRTIGLANGEVAFGGLAVGRALGVDAG